MAEVNPPCSNLIRANAFANQVHAQRQTLCVVASRIYHALRRLGVPPGNPLLIGERADFDALKKPGQLLALAIERFQLSRDVGNKVPR